MVDDSEINQLVNWDHDITVEFQVVAAIANIKYNFALHNNHLTHRANTNTHRPMIYHVHWWTHSPASMSCTSSRRHDWRLRISTNLAFEKDFFAAVNLFYYAFREEYWSPPSVLQQTACSRCQDRAAAAAASGQYVARQSPAGQCLYTHLILDYSSLVEFIRILCQLTWCIGYRAPSLVRLC